jgi:D-proline reductase (dithiol) PrdB
VPFDYLPVFAEKAAGKQTRKLVHPSESAWHGAIPALASARIALLTSAALRRPEQPVFVPPEDTSYRPIPAEPYSTDLVMDHRSPLGLEPREDPEIVFPRAALIALAQRGVIGSVASTHFSFVGGTRNHHGVEKELAPALAAELKKENVDLALLVPF